MKEKSFKKLEETITNSTLRYNNEFGSRLALDGDMAIEDVMRGRLNNVEQKPVLTSDGLTAWDISEYAFLQDKCPSTVNPSLWRMGRLNAVSGIFKVSDGIWQARAYDYANMTIIEGQTGWILVDPLMAKQAAEAALKDIKATLGERPISAVIITHTHPDHFGGIKGVIEATNPPPIYAPEGFMEYAASEGVLGGNHTSRRAIYQFGITLRPGPEGLIDGGIGKTVAKGERTFIPPTEFIGNTGDERLIDGVKFVFQMASGTEAPAEFTFFIPEHNVLCMAEVCTQTMHNLMPPRGAQVRDPLLWSRCIDEAITMFSENTNTLINSHNWPVWGKENVVQYLEEQRDIYKYTHDQVLRLANIGHTPHEIADLIQEPDWLTSKFHARGYYGTLKFNARAVYQRYYGSYDGNPVNLDPLPPEKLGKHYVNALGGAEEVLELAARAIETDELQWAATLLSHLIFSDSQNSDAKQLLALVHRHQGYREESGIMRNVYLVGAKELEEGVKPLPMSGGRNSDLAATLSPQDWFDAFALKLNPEKARTCNFVINFVIDCSKIELSLNRQVEFARVTSNNNDADLNVVTTLEQLEQLASGLITIEDALADGMKMQGNNAIFEHWLEMHDTFDLWFNIVTP